MLSDDFTFAEILKVDYQLSAAAKKGWMTRRQHGKGGKGDSEKPSDDTKRKAVEGMAREVLSQPDYNGSHKKAKAVLRALEQKKAPEVKYNKNGIPVAPKGIKSPDSIEQFHMYLSSVPPYSTYGRKYKAWLKAQPQPMSNPAVERARKQLRAGKPVEW